MNKLASARSENQTSTPSEGPSEERIAGEFAAQPAKEVTIAGSAPAHGHWFEILNSSVATTLITVLLGGVVGQLILSHFQIQQKNHEMAQEELRQTILRRQDIIQKALDLIGTARFDAETLIQLSQPRNDPRYYASNPQKQKKITDQRDKLLEDHSDVLKKWDAGHREMGLLLAYYNFGNPGIKTAWKTTADATTIYLNCAQLAYSNSQSPGSVNADPCSIERYSANDALEKLSDAMELANQSTWRDLKP